MLAVSTAIAGAFLSHFANPDTLKLAYGASAGFVAGKVMLPLMMLTAILVSMLPPEASLLFRTWHLALTQYAILVGLVTHSLTSIAIGAIFGALTGKVRSLKITHFGKESEMA